MSKIEIGFFESRLTTCLELIEQKLDWGTSNAWKTQDFERLSELISQDSLLSNLSYLLSTYINTFDDNTSQNAAPTTHPIY